MFHNKWESCMSVCSVASPRDRLGHDTAATYCHDYGARAMYLLCHLLSVCLNPSEVHGFDSCSGSSFFIALVCVGSSFLPSLNCALWGIFCYQSNNLYLCVCVCSTSTHTVSCSTKHPNHTCTNFLIHSDLHWASYCLLLSQHSFPLKC